jgi:hypothetical protein
MDVQAVGRSNVTYSTIAGLPLIHSAPNLVPGPIGPEVSFSTRLVLGFHSELLGDVGQVVEDVTGRPRDLDGVLDSHPATLAHVVSVPPHRFTDSALSTGALAGVPTAHMTGWVPMATP